VGKSSIINALKTKYANTFDHNSVRQKAKVGALPGVTRNVGFFKVCDKPVPCVVLDSPGVFIPTIKSEDQAFKLALINALPDTLAFDPYTLCDYLLFELNRLKCFDYVTVFKLPYASDSIDWVLNGVSKYIGAYTSDGQLDLNKAAGHFLRCYRLGKLGRVTLENEPTIVRPTTLENEELDPNNSSDLL
jgi:ribosome biogenesis GTPase A